MTLIISGTNRPDSNSLKVAHYYQQKIAEYGIEAKILHLDQLPANLIETDLYGERSPAFETIQQMVTAAKKFIFIIPEYNGSFPGILKLFIDACKFPDSFADKKAALVGISSGKYGNIRGVEHFTGVCNYIQLNVLPLKIHIPYVHKELNQQQQLHEQDTVKFTSQQIEKFISF